MQVKVVFFEDDELRQVLHINGLMSIVLGSSESMSI